MGYVRYGSWLGSACHEGWGFLGGPGGIIMGILFLIVIGVIVYLLVSRSRDRDEFKRYLSGSAERIGNPARSDALEILRNRFASGEISEDEFERMKKKLT